MGITSIQLNENEEKVLNYLKKYFHCDSSTLLKKSLYEMYEDIKDKEVIENFEKNEKDGSTSFVSIDKILKNKNN